MLLLRKGKKAFNYLKRALTPVRKFGRFRELSPFIERSGAMLEPKKETAHPQAVYRYGKPFIGTFHDRPLPRKTSYSIRLVRGSEESLVQVSLCRGNKIIGSVKLGFQPKTVVVEAIQGEAPHSIMQRLHLRTQKRWIDHLLHAIEDHAREQGYTHIRIRRPETLYYYHVHNASTQEPQSPATQAHMRALYYAVARANGYKKEDEYLSKRI